jgi:hypothetical protein
LAHEGPAVIDVVTDPNAISIPSHIDEMADTIEGNRRDI